MRARLGWILRAGGIGAILLTGCANAGLTPSASVTTAVQGWEHYFRIDWTSQTRPSGVDIDGYVYNKHGAPAGNVQVLAQALDAQDSVVGQKLSWVQGIVPNFGRSYFKISGLPPAQQYRVTIWAFDIIDPPGGRRRF